MNSTILTGSLTMICDSDKSRAGWRIGVGQRLEHLFFWSIMSEGAGVFTRPEWEILFALVSTRLGARIGKFCWLELVGASWARVWAIQDFSWLFIRSDRLYRFSRLGFTNTFVGTEAFIGGSDESRVWFVYILMDGSFVGSIAGFFACSFFLKMF